MMDSFEYQDRSERYWKVVRSRLDWLDSLKPHPHHEGLIQTVTSDIANTLELTSMSRHLQDPFGSSRCHLMLADGLCSLVSSQVLRRQSVS